MLIIPGRVPIINENCAFGLQQLWRGQTSSRPEHFWGLNYTSKHQISTLAPTGGLRRILSSFPYWRCSESSNTI